MWLNILGGGAEGVPSGIGFWIAIYEGTGWFTLPKTEELSPEQQANKISYVIIGFERGESGTEHWQGYIEFKSRVRFGIVRGLLPGSHIELRRRTGQQASDYCKKEGKWIEWGRISEVDSTRGQRTDLEEVKALIDTGASSLAVAEEHFETWARYYKAFDRYIGMRNPKQLRTELEVCYLWGSAGVGKSRLAMTKDPDAWISSYANLQWFDGYEGEETVVLDDYRGECSDSFILRLLDIYPMRVPVKGSTQVWRARKIFITSNSPPEELHANVSQAWKRRIHKTFHLMLSINFDDERVVEGWMAKI